MRYPVPWVTQYASPSLIEAIAYHGHPRAEDPRWRESGAPDLETYAAWCSRWCGMACFRMALLARDGVAPSLYELALGCAEYGAYVDGPDRPRGLIYRPFAEYARDKHAMEAEVIASVSSQIRLPQTDATRTGGHLVLVTGHADGLVTFHDPAGHTPEAGVATLPMPVFDRFAARRGVALHL
jgi:hypothetical protein